MKKTSILIDVDDEIYDQVVEPFKKQKTFAKLIRALLKGYSQNKYIYQFVESELDGVRQESISSIEDALTKMRSNISAMGVYTDELESIQKEGMDTFDTDNIGAEAGQEEVDKGDLKTFKEELLGDVKSEVSEIIKSAMSEMLKTLSAQGNLKVNSEAAATTEEPIKEVKKKGYSSTEEGDYGLSLGNDEDDDLGDIDFGIDPSLFEKDPEPEIAGDSTDILKDLLVGNSYSF